MSIKTNSTFRLANSTLVEPLINQWPAWSHLLSPVTASLHLLHHQIPTLQSYVKTLRYISAWPAIQSMPAALSATYPLTGSEKWKSCWRALRRNNAPIWSSLERSVTFITGSSMKPRGSASNHITSRCLTCAGLRRVGYDYYHNLRCVFSRQLYESDYYDNSLQSLRLSQLRHDSRPFFLSTPRLKTRGRSMEYPFEALWSTSCSS